MCQHHSRKRDHQSEEHLADVEAAVAEAEVIAEALAEMAADAAECSAEESEGAIAAAVAGEATVAAVAADVDVVVTVAVVAHEVEPPEGVMQEAVIPGPAISESEAAEVAVQRLVAPEVAACNRVSQMTMSPSVIVRTVYNC